MGGAAPGFVDPANPTALELRRRGHHVVLLDPGPIPHPLAESAALWLVRFYSSGEAAHRLRHEQKYGVQVTSYAAPTPTAGTW